MPKPPQPPRTPASGSVPSAPAARRFLRAAHERRRRLTRLGGWGAWLLALLAPVAFARHEMSLSQSILRVEKGETRLELRCQLLSLAEVIPALAPPWNPETVDELVRAQRPAIAEYVALHFRLFPVFQGHGEEQARARAASRAVTEPQVGAAADTTSDTNTDAGDESSTESDTGAPAPDAAALVARLANATVRYVPPDIERLAGLDQVDLVLPFEPLPPDAVAIGLEVSLFLETSPQHRELCRLEWFGEDQEAFLFSAYDPVWRWPPRRPPAARAWREFAPEGLALDSDGWWLALFAFGLASSAFARPGRLVLSFGLVSLALALAHPVWSDALAGQARWIELGAGLSLAYLGLDRLLHARGGGRSIESLVFGALHGLALGAALEEAVRFEYYRLWPTLAFGLGPFALFAIGAWFGSRCAPRASRAESARPESRGLSGPRDLPGFRDLPGSPDLSGAADSSDSIDTIASPARGARVISIALLVAGAFAFGRAFF